MPTESPSSSWAFLVIREKIISDRVRLLGNRMIINTKWTRKENGIDAKDENTISTNRYDINMGLYPGSDLPSFNIGFSSIHRSSEKERADQVIIEGIQGVANDTIVTDNRLETLTKQINLALTNTFELFGQQKMSLNIFQSNKKDLAPASSFVSFISEAIILVLSNAKFSFS